jgi:hypothetical protein
MFENKGKYFSGTAETHDGRSRPIYSITRKWSMDCHENNRHSLEQAPNEVSG